MPTVFRLSKMIGSPIHSSNEFTPAELIENITRHIQQDESGKPMRIDHGDIDDEFLTKKEHRVRPNRVYENIKSVPAFLPVGKTACAGIDNSDIFSTGKIMTEKDKEKEKAAKAICAVCLVRLDCLEYALKYKRPGIWGGLNEEQRSEINKKLLK